MSGGQFRATNLPLRTLISIAYSPPQSETPIPLAGGPIWLDSDRFDIVAKPEGNATPAQMALMLRSLLAERFKLAVHMEARELPIYELVLARADAKLGPLLHKSDVDCIAIRAAQQGAPRTPFTAGSPRPNCDYFGGFGRIAGGGTDIDELVGLLSRMVDRPVVNKTGLSGNYDFDLTFTPDVPVDRMPSPGSPLLPPGFDPNGPSIYTALQEQLGLQLKSARGPVDVLVIDHVERPSKN
jgi:uncharacterized protein (TIGR03435 family)